MSIVRFNPTLSSMLSRWPDIWDEDFQPLAPANNLDLYETENEVVVKANVAGVPEENLDITYERGVLWIKAEKAEAESDEKTKHYSKSSWNYSYKVAVPGMLDHTVEPEVTLEHGVVSVTFKKAEASKPKKLTVKKSV